MGLSKESLKRLKLWVLWVLTILPIVLAYASYRIIHGCTSEEVNIILMADYVYVILLAIINFTFFISSSKLNLFFPKIKLDLIITIFLIIGIMLLVSAYVILKVKIEKGGGYDFVVSLFNESILSWSVISILALGSIYIIYVKKIK